MTVRIEEVARSTYLLDCGQDAKYFLPQVAYLVIDDRPALIDPGSTVVAAELLPAIGSLGVDAQELAYIVPTHIHLDHGGGAGYLVQRLHKPMVVVHPRGADHLADPAKLVRGARFVFGDNLEQNMGPVLPVPRERLHVAGDGEIINLGSRDLRIVFAPGHATHHIAIEDSLSGGLFCGDALGFITDAVPDTPFPVGLPPFDADLYLQSIDKLTALSPKVIFYGHHRARTEAQALTRRLKEICLTLGEIIQAAIGDGLDDSKISERAVEYVKSFASLSALPLMVQVGISGYVQYYRSRSQPSP
ncbi:MAG: MBL fold metallo-hydrolase [Chloroflexi bacterium]|nr:MBL fold metallo-hydrolase [Chloroflexota bacterium]